MVQRYYLHESGVWILGVEFIFFETPSGYVRARVGFTTAVWVLGYFLRRVLGDPSQDPSPALSATSAHAMASRILPFLGFKRTVVPIACQLRSSLALVTGILSHVALYSHVPIALLLGRTAGTAKLASRHGAGAFTVQATASILCSLLPRPLHRYLLRRTITARN